VVVIGIAVRRGSPSLLLEPDFQVVRARGDLLSPLWILIRRLSVLNAHIFAFPWNKFGHIIVSENLLIACCHGI
jgi:hypothetical protein